jgi:hypothetical protein
MASLELSTVAQLLYTDMESVDFARIVSELDAVLTRMRGGDVVITWDCDDLVTFDVPETRILLGWIETGRRNYGGCLTVAVGPNPSAAETEAKAEHDVLCSRLVERIQGRYKPTGVMWRQIEGSVSSEQVDAMVEGLVPPAQQSLPPIDSILESLSRADLQMAEARANQLHPRAVHAPELSRMAMEPAFAEAAAPAPIAPRRPSRKIDVSRLAQRAAVAQAANDKPDLPLPKSAELARLRDALYPVDAEAEVAAEEKPVHSTQMRLAAHAMNATLIVVYAPLGAAVMTYSILRGEDMRLSGRVMAIVGTFFALAQTPMGQTVAAMARSIS